MCPHPLEFRPLPMIDHHDGLLSKRRHLMEPWPIWAVPSREYSFSARLTPPEERFCWSWPWGITTHHEKHMMICIFHGLFEAFQRPLLWPGASRCSSNHSALTPCVLPRSLYGWLSCFGLLGPLWPSFPWSSFCVKKVDFLCATISREAEAAWTWSLPTVGTIKGCNRCST